MRSVGRVSERDWRDCSVNERRRKREPSKDLEMFPELRLSQSTYDKTFDDLHDKINHSHNHNNSSSNNNKTNYKQTSASKQAWNSL